MPNVSPLTFDNIVRNTFIQVMSPSCRCIQRSRSVPKDVGSCKIDLEDDKQSLTLDGSTDVGSGSLSPTLTASPLWTPRQNDIDMWPMEWMDTFAFFDQLSVTEYTSLENCDLCSMTLDESVVPTHFTFPTDIWNFGDEPCPPSWTPTLPSACTPAPVTSPEFLSKQACDGSIMRNTFIEFDSQPSTPHDHSRSQSVPRDLGSLRIDSKVTRSIVVSRQCERESLVSPAMTASPFWSPRDRQKTDPEPTKCVLCLSQFL